MIVLLVAEFAGDSALFDQMCQGSVKPAAELARTGLNEALTVQAPFKFLAFNLPYKVIPILMGIRMRRHNPFSRKV